MNPRRLALVFVAALGPAALAAAQDAPKPAPARGGMSPSEAVAMMVKGASAGDLDATFGVLVDEQARPLKDWFQAQVELTRTINAQADALDAAFGKDAKEPTRRVDFDLKQELRSGFEGFAVVGEPKVEDDHATLQVRMTDKGPDGKVITRQETVQARKTDAGWKLSFDELSRADFPAGIAVMASLRAGLERTTKLVKDGTIKDRAAAKRELERDRPAIVPGNIPLPRFLTRPG